MNSFKKQLGMSFTGILFMLIIGGFFVLCLLKVGPLYYNNYKMDQIFLRMLDTAEPLESQTAAEIRKRLSAQFSVDGIRDIKADDIEIKREDGDVSLRYEHEDRVSLFANIDVIAKFENFISTAD